MLTKKQNLLETIRGGNPDRFVNQFEFMTLLRNDPVALSSNQRPQKGETLVNSWGVTISFPENVPGPFPVHDDEHKVITDVAKWKDVVKAPKLDYPQEEWDKYKPEVEAIDRNETFVAAKIAPGLFEQVHYLMGMDDCFLNLYEEPEVMKELIEYIADWEVEYARLICENYHPDALFHHDDWGSYRSSFLSPQMFEEFIVPAYKKIYGFYKENGVKLIVHHSDSYAANLIPYMIEMGIDIFQGCTTTNNVPELVEKYGGQISFMGDLDNGLLDVEGWTSELIEKEVKRACETNGKYYFIPCLAAGGARSVYPGVYEAVSENVDKMSRQMF